jgi:hypothetical protein
MVSPIELLVKAMHFSSRVVLYSGNINGQYSLIRSSCPLSSNAVTLVSVTFSPSGCGSIVMLTSLNHPLRMPMM